MEEVVDGLVEMVEKKLDQIGIELEIDELDSVRDVLDYILESKGEYDE